MSSVPNLLAALQASAPTTINPRSPSPIQESPPGSYTSELPNLDKWNLVLEKRKEIEQRLFFEKAFLSNAVDKQKLEDNTSPEWKKALASSMKMERKLSKLVKAIENASQSGDTEKDRDTLLSISKSFLKHFEIIKKAHQEFQLDLSFLSDAVKSTPSLPESAKKKEKKAPKMKKTSTLPYRHSNDPFKPGGIADDEIEIPNFNTILRESISEPIIDDIASQIPELSPLNASYDASTEHSIQRQLVQLEVKLKTIDEKQLRRILVSLASESPEMLQKVSEKIEDTKTPLTSSSNGLKKPINRQRSWHFPKKVFNMRKPNSDSTGGGPTSDGESSLTAKIANSLREGNLMFKIKNIEGWKKRWVVLDENNIYIFRSPEDSSPKTIISLFCTSVRIEKSLHFTILSADNTYCFNTDTEKDALQWTGLIEDVISNIIHKTIGSDSKNLKALGKTPSIDVLPSSTSDTELSETKKELFELLKIPGNEICADCGTKGPEWLSLNLGVFICIECSGAHRNLGTHISKVRSIQYDEIDSEQMLFLRNMGNIKANRVYEANIPDNLTKPSPQDKLNVKTDWIRAKYANLQFADRDALSAVSSLSHYDGKPSIRKSESASALIQQGTLITSKSTQLSSIDQETSKELKSPKGKLKKTDKFGTVSHSFTSKSSSPSVIVRNPLYGKEIPVKLSKSTDPGHMSTSTPVLPAPTSSGELPQVPQTTQQPPDSNQPTTQTSKRPRALTRSLSSLT